MPPQFKIHKSYIFYLSALIIAGVTIFAHQLISQPVLDHGDHGLNLYAFEQAANGKIVYKDFWWPFGPLGPYYYGFFMKLFDHNIKSVLLGQILLKLTSGILLFYNLSLFFKTRSAFLGTLFFWIFFKDFFYTYNHSLAFPLIFLSMTGLFQYIKTTGKAQYNKLIIFISCFLISLVRINIGIALLLGYFFILCLIDFLLKKKNSYYLTDMTITTMYTNKDLQSRVNIADNSGIK